MKTSLKLKINLIRPALLETSYLSKEIKKGYQNLVTLSPKKGEKEEKLNFV
jgi:hypothetical protein